jgi:bacillithiol biosynthesis cysteine-adding enzyme BshC
MTCLDIRMVPGSSALIRDYVHAFDRLRAYYGRDPHAADAFAEVAEICSRRDYHRDALRSALLGPQTRWAAPPVTRRRIEDLCAPHGLAVCTGQQTGLFGGPLFTLYKALTAVALAARLERELGRPVVPLFWMASEDHDVAEADHVHLLDRGGRLNTLRHAAWGSASGFMPANLRLGPAIQDTLRQVWDALPATEFTDPLRASLDQAYAPDRTLADAFARWILSLIGDTGLVMVDAADPALKRLAAGILRREIEEAPRTSAAIMEVSRALRAQGYPAQIDARPDGVNCFLLAGGRRALSRDTGGLKIRDTGEFFPVAALSRMAEESPERFSPNVALRPVIQDQLFPTLAYVAGPGELAYFAQLRPVYEAFDVPMPVIVPRATLSLVEPRIAQLLHRFHLELQDLVTEPEQLASRILRAQLPPDLGATLATARQDVEEIFRRVGEAIAAVDPTLKATAGQTGGHIKGHLDQLEKKAVQALKRREADTGQQLQRLRDALMPGGKLQERVYPLLPYLAKYGPALVRLLRDHIRGPGWTHQLVAIARDGEGREETGQTDPAREDRPLP